MFAFLTVMLSRSLRSLQLCTSTDYVHGLSLHSQCDMCTSPSAQSVPSTHVPRDREQLKHQSPLTSAHICDVGPTVRVRTPAASISVPRSVHRAPWAPPRDLEPDLSRELSSALHMSSVVLSTNTNTIVPCLLHTGRCSIRYLRLDVPNRRPATWRLRSSCGAATGTCCCAVR